MGGMVTDDLESPSEKKKSAFFSIAKQGFHLGSTGMIGMYDVLSFFSWFFHGVEIKHVFFLFLGVSKEGSTTYLYVFFLKLIAVDQCKLVISL